MASNMEWVDSVRVGSGEYFDISEGDNRVQLLSYCAPLALKWTGTKYEPAEEGDTNVSIKGVCWVLQDGVIKSAKLPYTVVKAIRELMNDEDYAFTEFPMPRLINIKAKNAGSKEVEYQVVPSPKEIETSDETLKELLGKPTPEEMVEKLKGKKPVETGEDDREAPGPEEMPF